MTRGNSRGPEAERKLDEVADRYDRRGNRSMGLFARGVKRLMLAAQRSIDREDERGEKHGPGVF